MPAGKPSVGEIWHYHGRIPLNSYIGTSYCVVIEESALLSLIHILFWNAHLMWGDQTYTTSLFTEAFSFVPIMPGLDPDVIAFMKDLTTYHDVPPCMEPTTPGKSEWDHLKEVE